VADCLRVELHAFGVQVGLVEPGVVDTDPWHEMNEVIDALEAGLDPEQRSLARRIRRLECADHPRDEGAAAHAWARRGLAPRHRGVSEAGGSQA